MWWNLGGAGSNQTASEREWEACRGSVSTSGNLFQEIHFTKPFGHTIFLSLVNFELPSRFVERSVTFTIQNVQFFALRISAQLPL